MTQPALGETKQQILLLLLGRHSTAEELAAKLTLNLSVVRRHLEDLVAQRLVESSFNRKGRGRPSKHYSISEDGRAKVSSKYDMIAELLTMAMKNDLGSQEPRELYKSAGQILANSVGSRQNPESLMPALTEFGFLPELRSEGKKQLIVSKNCPILRLAQKYPELTCDTFHTVFLRQVLGTPRVNLKQAIARGAPECIHEYRSAVVTGSLTPSRVEHS